MSPQRQAQLLDIGRTRGTPCYVYFADEVAERARALVTTFGGRFAPSYAVKVNPNGALLARLRESIGLLDVSSGGELARALAAGWPAGQVSFSGPAKREPELRAAVAAGCTVVCESPDELAALDRLAGDARIPVLLRINPARMPRGFGVNMAGKPSQFGIDEEDLPAVLEGLPSLRKLDLQGFHVYSGTNCLDVAAIAENYAIFIELFQRFARRHDLSPRKLVFGAGLGIPYFAGEQALDLGALAARVNPMLDELRAEPRFAGAKLVLELGRWLVGPAGYLLTRVVAAKRSRGTEIRLCDAGFNNHLSACGMMGTVIRRNWPISNLEARAGEAQRYLLAGPLCTTFDVLSPAIDLPPTEVGDLLAVGVSGAYGLTASPTGFISHPVPREYLVDGTRVSDVSEPPRAAP